MKVIFETARLYTRQYSDADVEYFYRLNGDPEVMRYIREPKSREACNLFLLQNLAFYKQFPLMGRWAMFSKEPHAFVGSYAIIPVENSTDIQLGYSLLPEHWGKGYASEATLAGLQYAFEVMGLERIVGITRMENLASQKVLLKCGFVQIDNLMENGRELFRFEARRQITGLTPT
jgi:ribosomal-protein-alanine N-acetyltransferase